MIHPEAKFLLEDLSASRTQWKNWHRTNIPIPKGRNLGNSLAVQGLGLHNFTAKGQGSIPGQEPKIPQAMQHGQKKKKRGNLKNWKEERDDVLSQASLKSSKANPIRFLKKFLLGYN